MADITEPLALISTEGRWEPDQEPVWSTVHTPKTLADRVRAEAIAAAGVVPYPALLNDLSIGELREFFRGDTKRVATFSSALGQN